MEPRISALNWWEWVLKQLWVPTFHLLVFCLGLVVLPQPSVRIVPAGHANALGESGGATHGALLGEGAGDVGGEVLDDNMMGLRGMIDPQVIKVFDKKGHHPGKFSVKYKHRVMEKTSTGF